MRRLDISRRLRQRPASGVWSDLLADLPASARRGLPCSGSLCPPPRPLGTRPVLAEGGLACRAPREKWPKLAPRGGGMEAGRWSRGCGSGIGLSGHKNSYRCVPAAAGLPPPRAPPRPAPAPGPAARAWRHAPGPLPVAKAEWPGRPRDGGEGGARTGPPPDDPVPPGAPLPPPCGGGGAGLTGGGGSRWMAGWMDGL